MKNLSSYILENYLLSNLSSFICEEEDELKQYYERNAGEKWEKTHDLDDELKKLDDSKNKSNLKSIESWIVDKNHYIVKFYGGLNGSGKWKDYLDDIKKIITSFEHAYIIKLDVDVLDDVWTLYVGIRKK